MDGNAQKETCRAPAPGPDGFVPARPRVVLALAVLVLAGMAGFCLALYHSLIQTGSSEICNIGRYSGILRKESEIYGFRKCAA